MNKTMLARILVYISWKVRIWITSIKTDIQFRRKLDLDRSLSQLVFKRPHYFIFYLIVKFIKIPT